MGENEKSAAIRSAAFAHLGRLTDERGTLSSKDLNIPFRAGGEQIRLANRPRGIWKPRQMDFLLSIKSVFPREAGRLRYADQVEIRQLFNAGRESVFYSFMGSKPDTAVNRWLREAMEHRIPLIYFVGFAPQRYLPILPAYITDWEEGALRAQVAFGPLARDSSDFHLPEHPDERRYALRECRQRLHQASFREEVMRVYGSRCAFSGLSEPLLLDAAHILPDRDPGWGQPVVQNGLPMSKIHHAAFDSHLLGIDPDYRIHVADQLADKENGPLTEVLQDLHGTPIHRPKEEHLWPDRERLEQRFAQFLRAG